MSISFISNAFAAAPAAATGSDYSSIFLLIGFVIIFYFLLWRPQSKRAKEQRDMLAKLQEGDEVVTVGGILGKITKFSDNYIFLKIGDGLEVMLEKGSVSRVLPKGSMQETKNIKLENKSE